MTTADKIDATAREIDEKFGDRIVNFKQRIESIPQDVCPKCGAGRRFDNAGYLCGASNDWQSDLCRIAELARDLAAAREQICILVGDVERSVETLECGHPIDCLTTALESQTKFCGWCQSLEIQRDAIAMEKELKQQLADRDRQIEGLVDSIREARRESQISVICQSDAGVMTDVVIRVRKILDAALQQIAARRQGEQEGRG